MGTESEMKVESIVSISEVAGTRQSDVRMSVILYELRNEKSDGGFWSRYG